MAYRIIIFLIFSTPFFLKAQSSFQDSLLHYHTLIDQAKAEGNEQLSAKLEKRCTAFEARTLGWIEPTGDFRTSLKDKYKALSQQNEFLNNNLSKSPLWEELGPTTWPNCKQECFAQGLGRLDYILLDSLNQRIFVCSPAGGTFVSYNEGESFVNAGTDKLPVIGASCIQVAPGLPNTWFVASGEADGKTYDLSMGVYRTMDGGESWQAINATLEGPKLETNLEYAWNPLRIREILIHPEDGNRIWAATNRGLYYCNSALTSSPIWQKLAPGEFYDIEFMHGRADTIFAGGSALWISTNSGRSFDQKNPPDEASAKPGGGYQRFVIRSSKADAQVYAFRLRHNRGNLPALIYKYIPNLDLWKFYTQYEDKRYANFGDGHLNPGRGQSIAISPLDPKIWFAGNINLTKSSDSGITWKTLRGIHIDMHYLTFSADGKTLWVANDGGLYKSEDGGETFEIKSEGLGVATLYYMDVSRLKPEMIAYGAQDTGSLLRDEDGNWTLHLSGDGQGCAFHPSDTSIIYLSESPNGRKVFRTQNMGYSWRPVLYGSKLGSPYYSDVSVSSAYPDAIYHPGKGVNLSLNRGNDWRQIGSWTDRVCMEVFPHHTNPEKVYTRVYDNTPGAWKHELYFTQNAFYEEGKPEWNQVELPENNAFRLSLKRDESFYIGFQSFKSTVKKVLFYNGSWFEDLTYNLGHRPAYDLVHVETQWGDHLFLGTDQGVYHLPPNDTVWLPYGEMPRVRVNDLSIDYAQNQILAGSFGRGVWRVPLPETGSIRWNKDLDVLAPVYLNSNLIIGRSSVVIAKSDIFIPEGKGVYIEPGGKLILEAGADVRNSANLDHKGILLGRKTPPKWLAWLIQGQRGELIRR